jgi:hypothetical protein
MTLTKNEFAATRADQEKLFTDTVTIQRPVVESDDHGGQFETFRNIATLVRARIAPDTITRLSDGEQRGDRISETSQRILSVAFDQDIDTKDRVEHDGVTYEVTRINDHNSYRTARRVRLTRVG